MNTYIAIFASHCSYRDQLKMAGDAFGSALCDTWGANS